MAAAGVLIGAVIGCVGPNGLNSSGGGANGQGGNGAGNSTGSGTIGGDSGLPCEIADVLSAKCISCHGSPPSGGAPMSLLSYADLTAQSNGKSYAQLSLERMQANTMPPGGGATAADIQAFQNWINAGTQQGTCGGLDGGTPDPTFQGDPTCTGKSFQPPTYPDWQEVVGDMMYPGRACITCHKQDEGPIFSVAGTVFDTGKVIDNCLPPDPVDIQQAKVIITDKNGNELPLDVNANGNFAWEDYIAKPYKARVEYKGKVRAMSAEQTDGDCNKCHAEVPTNGAPGRIALPQ